MTPQSIYTIYSVHPGIIEIKSLLSEEKTGTIHLKGVVGSSVSLILSALFDKLGKILF